MTANSQIKLFNKNLRICGEKIQFSFLTIPIAIGTQNFSTITAKLSLENLLKSFEFEYFCVKPKQNKNG